MTNAFHIRTTAVRAVVLVFAALGASCASGPSTPHEALTAGAEPLRSHFNRDAGHTRIVLLAAPT